MQNINWQPEIGDPTFAGWFTVFSYFLASFLAYRVYTHSLKSTQNSNNKQCLFWLLICLFSIAMGINKQLDLQSLLTATAKYLAHQHGWYKQRRFVQVFFILLMFLIGTYVTGYGLRFFNTILRYNWLAFVGISFLVLFILIRATSFHHMDRLIGTYFLGLKMNWLMELSGIYCIVINAVWVLKHKIISS